jgi:hypothetical protein
MSPHQLPGEIASFVKSAPLPKIYEDAIRTIAECERLGGNPMIRPQESA